MINVLLLLLLSFKQLDAFIKIFVCDSIVTKSGAVLSRKICVFTFVVIIFHL